MSRNIFNWIFGVASVVVAIWSISLAMDPVSTIFSWDHKKTGYALVALWGLAPPVFFWVDWVWFCRGLTKDQLDVAKHTHDLSRNIWLALLAFLAILFEVKP